MGDVGWVQEKRLYKNDFHKNVLDKLINQNLYSAPYRSILRGAPDPGHTEQSSLQKLRKLRTCTVWEVPYS